MSQNEFFTVHHSLNCNIELLPTEMALPSMECFEKEIPTPFIVANEFSHIDQLNEQTQQDLKSKELQNVVLLLEAQNRKLNLLITFLLAQQDDPQYRKTTTSFGASQFSFYNPKPLEIGGYARVKLFLEQPSAAIYCYTEIIACQPIDNENNEDDSANYEITMLYKRLRERDQDLLIKTALNQQQKLLHLRYLNRDKS